MDVKSNLKEAREAIKNKDYKTSLKLCKAILREDKSNYMGLVLLGISLQEVGPIDQAQKAFQKAISLNEENILAWNGLINYYEKHGASESRDLVSVYVKVLDLERKNALSKRPLPVYECLPKVFQFQFLMIKPEVKDTQKLVDSSQAPQKRYFC